MSLSGRLNVDGPPFGIQVDLVSRQVRVVGELDLATAPLLVESAMALQALSGSVTIDLQSITFIDASALGALVDIAIRQRESANELRVLGNARVRRIATICGLESMLSN